MRGALVCVRRQTRERSRRSHIQPATLNLSAGSFAARPATINGAIVLQSQNAMAVHPPSDSVNPAPAASSAETVTAESLGRQLRAALPPLRLHSVSLYDEQSNVLWLSEGALGPDEHGLVTEAMETLGAETARATHEIRLEDGRAALFLAVRAPKGALVGLAMILADNKSVSEGLSERLITPQTRTIMQKIAVLVRPASTRAPLTNPALRVLELRDTSTDEVTTEPTTGDLPANDLAVPPLTPEAVDAILELELVSDTPAANLVSDPPATNPGRGPEPLGTAASRAGGVTVTTRSARVLNAAAAADSATTLRPASSSNPTALLSAGATTNSAKALAAQTTTGTAKVLAATGTSQALALPEVLSLFLDALPYSRLRTGGQSRRYEVVARAMHRDVQRVPPGLDHYALQRLLTWLGTNRGAWSTEPTSFTLSLSIATLEDERFPQFVAANLKTHGIAAQSIGFEIAEALCLQRRAQVERFISLCDKLGCFVVIDDFSFESSAFALLRSKALRLVKIDPKLTSVALKDKLAQAMVVAIAQAVKVLGIHCSAKRVETPSALQWLTAIGCDFAQGPALCLPQALESLGGPTIGAAAGQR